MELVKFNIWEVLGLDEESEEIVEQDFEFLDEVGVLISMSFHKWDDFENLTNEQIKFKLFRMESLSETEDTKKISKYVREFPGNGVPKILMCSRLLDDCHDDDCIFLVGGSTQSSIIKKIKKCVKQHLEGAN